MRVSWTFRAAAVLGFLGVVMGALGAHGLKPELAAFGTADLWVTAVMYQLLHAVALLALAVADRASRLVAGLWIVGLIFFSGSLYFLALSEFKAYLWPITPLGGMALLVGWAVLFVRGR
jgi:uncharacterized membrane protein YgdD (TMEM256/DUF423 family)